MYVVSVAFRHLRNKNRFGEHVPVLSGLCQVSYVTQSRLYRYFHLSTVEYYHVLDKLDAKNLVDWIIAPPYKQRALPFTKYYMHKRDLLGHIIARKAPRSVLFDPLKPGTHFNPN